jgi:Asp-tRNA(Asn)/Glu-tRNA(Gln) amidotransferase A subunit family amidase
MKGIGSMLTRSEYEAYDALGLAALIANRQVSASEVLETAISNVEAINPAVNAVVHKMYDGGRSAVAAGLPPGPLAGVPFLIKDVASLCKGAPCGNGSRLFNGFIAEQDDTVVERYKAAGLIIIGRTNSPEFALAPTTEPVANGPTRNPWDLTRSAGGSSGGAAAAVAARMVPAAHAVDGGGSIRIPAANCGLFGLKPTRARTPSGPLVGEGWGGMLVSHAVTRSVRDSAALLDAIAGPAPGDPYWAPPQERAFLEEIGRDPGRLRIALTIQSPTGGDVHSECIIAATSAAKLCAELGHRVEEAAPSFDMASTRWARDVVISGWLRNEIDTRLEALGRPQRADDLERITALQADRGAQYSARDYVRAMVILHSIGRRFAAFFVDYDILLSPVAAQPPEPLGTSDMTSDDADAFIDHLSHLLCFTRQFNVTGGPAAAIPLHWTEEGLPVGVQFAADFGNEALLFRLAAQLERARPWHERWPSVRC